MVVMLVVGNCKYLKDPSSNIWDMCNIFFKHWVLLQKNHYRKRPFKIVLFSSNQIESTNENVEDWAFRITQNRPHKVS